MLFDRSKKRILIVDENKDFLGIAQSVLEFAGFNTETTYDGEEALGHIRKLKYDLLVLGVLMPRIDGIRLLQAVRESKIYAEVPILFITGYSPKGRLETRLRETACKNEEGIQDPFENKLFLETVTFLLKKKKIPAEVQLN